MTKAIEYRGFEISKRGRRFYTSVSPDAGCGNLDTAKGDIDRHLRNERESRRICGY